MQKKTERRQRNAVQWLDLMSLICLLGELHVEDLVKWPVQIHTFLAVHWNPKITPTVWVGGNTLSEGKRERKNNNSQNTHRSRSITTLKMVKPFHLITMHTFSEATGGSGWSYVLPLWYDECVHSLNTIPHWNSSTLTPGPHVAKYLTNDIFLTINTHLNRFRKWNSHVESICSVDHVSAHNFTFSLIVRRFNLIWRKSNWKNANV